MDRRPYDFARAPFLVIWEVTRACALACVHCRADAIARRDPAELTTEEGRHLIDQVRACLYESSLTAPFGIKTTEAPHYRRVVATRDRESARDLQAEAGRLGPRQLRAPRAVNDGNGFVFVDHVGAICPSGFLPLPRGNVRDGTLAGIYREDEVFRRLRDPDALGDHCGRCEWRAECGGSRSRAFAATGDPFAGDPLCAYRPR